MRVCFPFVGEGIGGSHVSALELIDKLPEHGIRPLVVLHKRGPLADLLRNEGIRFTLLRWSKFAAGHEATYSADKRLLKVARWRFALYLRRNRIDIVHTNDIRVGCTWLPAAAAGGARFVWHQRTPGSRHTFNHFAARADRIICPSLYVRDRIFENINSAFLKKDFGWAKILCVRNPISLSSTSTTHPGRIDTRSFPRVGLIANEWSRKRPEIFVATASQVLKSLPAAEFLIAGEFSDEGKLQLLSPWPKAVTKRVKFLGFVEDRSSLFGRIDILLAPAVNEGFGRTLVEAMLAGVAVIAADSGGHQEIVEHGTTGLLVPVDDVEGFAAAVCVLAHDSKMRSRLIRTAQLRVDKLYDPRAIAREMAEIYRGLKQFGLIEQLNRISEDWRWLHSKEDEEEALWP